MDLIAADRQSLAQRVAHHPWWHTLATAALTTALVASPLTGSVWFVVMIAALTSALAAIVMVVGLRMLSRTMAQELLHAR